MKYISEFRDPRAARRVLEQIENASHKPVRFMEFCGGHTHAILRFGLRQLLPPTVQLSTGPGCPVCVTSSRDLDRAIAIAHLPGVILTTFGDMMRVPGSQGSLQNAQAEGADVRMVYSTLDAIAIARANPQCQVVFLGIGFETTAPTIAAALLQAQAQRLDNLSVLSLHKLTSPATRAILDAGEVALSGVIGPGHVTAIIGADAWRFLPAEYQMPCAIAGFEPLDMLRAILSLVRMVEDECPAVVNTYGRGAGPTGNAIALQMMEQVFRVAEAEWRGLGVLPASGLALAPEFEAFDAAIRFPVAVDPAPEPRGCRCGEVLRGVIAPLDCPLFGSRCTPANPVGPCMVSGEGACAAYLQYQGV